MVASLDVSSGPSIGVSSVLLSDHNWPEVNPKDLWGNKEWNGIHRIFEQAMTNCCMKKS
jgi:hypothetical protein